MITSVNPKQITYQAASGALVAGQKASLATIDKKSEDSFANPDIEKE